VLDAFPAAFFPVAPAGIYLSRQRALQHTHQHIALPCRGTWPQGGASEGEVVNCVMDMLQWTLRGRESL